MSPPVSDIVELVGPDRPLRQCLGQGLGEAAGIFHIVVGILVGDRGNLDEFGTEQPQGILLLLALGNRNDDDRPEAHGIGHDREADAGIARRPLDNGPARPQLALGDGVLDDEQRGAILHRLARIHELGLAEDGAAGQLRGLFQLDQGGVADRGNDIRLDIHEYSDRLKGRDRMNR